MMGDRIGIRESAGLSLELFIERTDQRAQKGKTGLLRLLRFESKIDPEEMQHRLQHAEDRLVFALREKSRELGTLTGNITTELFELLIFKPWLPTRPVLLLHRAPVGAADECQLILRQAVDAIGDLRRPREIQLPLPGIEVHINASERCVPERLAFARIGSFERLEDMGLIGRVGERSAIGIPMQRRIWRRDGRCTEQFWS